MSESHFDQTIRDHQSRMSERSVNQGADHGSQWSFHIASPTDDSFSCHDDKSPVSGMGMTFERDNSVRSNLQAGADDNVSVTDSKLSKDPQRVIKKQRNLIMSLKTDLVKVTEERDLLLSLLRQHNIELHNIELPASMVHSESQCIPQSTQISPAKSVRSVTSSIYSGSQVRPSLTDIERNSIAESRSPSLSTINSTANSDVSNLASSPLTAASLSQRVTSPVKNTDNSSKPGRNGLNPQPTQPTTPTKKSKRPHTQTSNTGVPASAARTAPPGPLSPASSLRSEQYSNALPTALDPRPTPIPNRSQIEINKALGSLVNDAVSDDGESDDDGEVQTEKNKTSSGNVSSSDLFASQNVKTQASQTTGTLQQQRSRQLSGSQSSTTMDLHTTPSIQQFSQFASSAWATPSPINFSAPTFGSSPNEHLSANSESWSTSVTDSSVAKSTKPVSSRGNDYWFPADSSVVQQLTTPSEPSSSARDDVTICSDTSVSNSSVAAAGVAGLVSGIIGATGITGSTAEGKESLFRKKGKQDKDGKAAKQNNRATVVNSVPSVQLFVEPDKLTTITVQVSKSVLSHRRKPRNTDPEVVLACCDRATGKEIWKIRKTHSSLVNLNNSIYDSMSAEYYSLPKVPEKSLFLSHAPNKIDTRRQELTSYFAALLSIPSLPYEVGLAICEYLSTDMINPLELDEQIETKSGYLTVKRKGLGTNWKARFCIIEENTLLIYENDKCDNVISRIPLTGVQIGAAKSQVSDSSDSKSYRHAFLLLEPKKNSSQNSVQSYIQHVFCAESDEDRDDWIHCICQVINPAIMADTAGNFSQMSINEEPSNEQVNPYSSTINSVGTNTADESSKRSRKRNIFGFRSGKNNGGASDSGVVDSNLGMNNMAGIPQSFSGRGSFLNLSTEDTLNTASFRADHQRTSSNGSNRIPDAYKSLLSMNTPNVAGSTDTPRTSSPNRSIFGGGTEITDNPYYQANSGKPQVFGVSLQESLKISQHLIYDRVKVPSIVYRCITYLEATGAVYEEGLFRLSGSSSLIKQLKESFNTKFDIDLLAMKPMPDINSTAGLLKLYLRELPTKLVPSELFGEFSRITAQEDLALIARDFKTLTSQLPEENQHLLYALFRFLSSVVAKKDINKMNVRNLVLVFTPTLNIPIDILIPFISDFSYIFDDGELNKEGSRHISEVLSQSQR